MTFILASASPQRRRILEDLGVSFTVVHHAVDESAIMETDPMRRAQILAEQKAKSITKYPEQWIIGCDTLVVSESGELLEKPVDADDARRMLLLHSGKTSTIHSALCLVRAEEKYRALSTARVTFKKLSSEIIEWWIRTKLWEGRSGAFQIEGEGQKIVETLEGELETVVGFPVSAFVKFCLLLERQ